MQDKDDYSGVLGLEHQAVRFHDPTPLWAELYEQEERCIRTALPGIKAKPILDILVGVRRFERLGCEASRWINERGGLIG